LKARDYRIPIIYIVLGVLWITLSDSFLKTMESYLTPEIARYTASLKGIFYVFATGFLLYFLLKREQKKLAEGNNKRMTEIIDKMNNLVIVSDIEGNITWVNHAFVKVTGYTMQEALGKTHGALLYGPKTDMEVVKTLSKAIKNKEFFSGELVNYAKGGKEYWSQFNLSPMFNAKGGLEGYMSIENNIDDSKHKEDLIVQQHQKLKAVSWLNSHEIRKPVASIMALTELILEETDQEEQKELVKYLRQTTLDLDLIIHQINEEAAVK